MIAFSSFFKPSFHTLPPFRHKDDVTPFHGPPFGNLGFFHGEHSPSHPTPFGRGFPFIPLASLETMVCFFLRSFGDVIEIWGRSVALWLSFTNPVFSCLPFVFVGMVCDMDPGTLFFP